MLTSREVVPEIVFLGERGSVITSVYCGAVNLHNGGKGVASCSSVVQRETLGQGIGELESVAVGVLGHVRHGGGELEVHGVADLDAVVLLVVGAVLDGLLDGRVGALEVLLDGGAVQHIEQDGIGATLVTGIGGTGLGLTR